MSSAPSTSSIESLSSTQKSITDRLKQLYRAVDESETPLPRSWSPKDKFTYIGLSQNDLRVHYKGIGKTHKDAASVRATHPIPASSGIYYFEIKVISKGRDGYMGIGLSTQGVNTNRLPGWDKHSYGYHGDDGHSFCSSGTGVPYGPTFTTGDIIGCCLNLIDNTCFYTKNGINLGIAFSDLPHNLYPTVGLQTPGEVVEANFGQHSFIFDIEDYMKEWHRKTKHTIQNLPVEDKKGEWQTALQRIISTYLVHHGYCATAEAFARSTGQAFEEELASIKNRQRIQKLVLAGRIGEALETTHQLYPGLLERNTNLLFMLKCRQFIEMVNGTDSEVRGAICSPKSRHGSGSARSSPSMSPVHHSMRAPLSGNSSPIRLVSSKAQGHGHTSHNNDLRPISESNQANSVTNGADADIDMESSDGESLSNGTTNGSCLNGAASGDYADMDIDQPKKQMCGGSQAAIEKMLQFGKELNTMSVQLKRENGKNETNKKVLQNAFSLLAYADPWNSPVGFQLDPVQREPVCAALNSAILESHGLPKQPPLELAINQASECMTLMAKSAIGSCAFAAVEDYLH